MSIESNIEKGVFVIGECIKCKNTIWPPSNYCSNCFGTVAIKKGPTHGKIIEFSKQDKEYFCLVEFDKNLKIIGKMSTGIPTIEQKVSIKKCGIHNGNYFFEFV